MTPTHLTPDPRARGDTHPAGARARAGSSSGSLGTTKEITQPPETEKPIYWRLRRYRLQSLSRELLPELAIAYCLRSLIPRHQAVEIWKAKDQARYKGLQTCGSPWVCPVCASRIAECRRQELIKANRNWIAAGGTILHLIQTVPHHRGQSLKFLTERFTHARRLMRNRKPWGKWKKENDLAGTLRTLETTYGFENGWHVHSHEELFFRAPVDQFDVQAALHYMWKDACKSVGLGEPTFRRGLQVQDGSYAAKYMAKWGIESEMTKSHIKRARGGNYGPFDLLEQYGQGKGKFEPLFMEYARAFHGKKQMHWSNGMRELLGLGVETPDEVLAAEIEEDAILLGSLDSFLWKRVCQAEKRGELLEIAATKGWQGVLDFIGDLF